MCSKANTVFIALSGGVDSSTAAAVLLRAGYRCEAVFMVTCDHNEQNVSEAGIVAKELGIRLHVLDLREDFNKILDYFCDEYARARTPNPCVVCNRIIKFGKLCDFAQAYGADFLATGHYARIMKEDGEFRLYQGVDTGKDQSYVLSMVNREILPNVLLPMGDYTKEKTRQMASEFGLSTVGRDESQEICFIPNDDYVLVLEQRRPDLVRRGDIVDPSGQVIGEHDGVHRFTIGQRRGLRVAMGQPYYVVGLDAKTNTVTLAPKEGVMHKQLLATDVNWLVDKPRTSFEAIVKIRYNDKGTTATVVPEGNNVHVEFREPRLAITPGQLAVFYINQPKGYQVAGGGWIEAVCN